MKALLEVQKEIEALSKDSKNPFFKSKYLDLPTLLKNVKPVLNKHGLILLQPVENRQVFSLLVDAESGENICGSGIPLPDIKDPQKLGAAITYFRRYTLTSLLAIEEQDDDGNKASRPEPKRDINKELESCKTLEELKKVYLSLCPADQKKYASKKDEIKNRIS